MAQRKTWSHEEDQFINQKVDLNSKLRERERLKWGDIAQKLNQKFTQSKRTGKQCRQRWHNQLDPSILHVQWSVQEEKKLFQLQKKLGNKWALIASNLQGRTDNNVKNYFYSTLRKSLRKINTFISINRSQLKTSKQFKQSSLSKLLAVADHKFDNKINIKKETAQHEALQIKNLLIQITDIQTNDQKSKKLFINVIQKLQDFNKSCKRKKGKKKQKPEENRYEESQQEDEKQVEEQFEQIQQQKLSKNQRSRSRNKKMQKKVSKSSMSKKNAPGTKQQQLNQQKLVKQPSIPKLNKDPSLKMIGFLDNSRNFEQYNRSSMDLRKVESKNGCQLTDSFNLFKSFGMNQNQTLSDSQKKRTNCRFSRKQSNFIDTIKQVKQWQLKKNESRVSQVSNLGLKEYEFQSMPNHRLDLFKQKSSFKELPPLHYQASGHGSGMSFYMDSSMKFEPQLSKLRSFSRNQSNMKFDIDQYQFDLNNIR